MPADKPKVYVVPTPVGNLEDITLRAIRILKEADLILAEDTRVSKHLLNHYGIDTPVMAHHQHNEHRVLTSMVDRVRSGNTLAIITDAGTPGISDPGFLLIRECLREDLDVECLPGATAFVPALVCSGLPCDRFVFEGFLPVKKGRKTRLEALREEPRTMVFYESPYRLVKTLKEFAEIFGADRPASVAREISKIFEEHQRGTLEELIKYYEAKTVKGEICISLGGLPN